MTIRSAFAPPRSLVAAISRIAPRFLPFADAASAEFPLSRVLRLSLFQISVGMAMALTVGTLNRVMIVELGVPAWLVAVMVALPLAVAPLRALTGHRSDTHRSALGWRRVPFIWFGTLLQFGGLSIMPFALLVLSGDNGAPVLAGQLAAALAFLLVGAGLQTTQTAGLALASDLSDDAQRPRVVALMYVMLLAGMVLSSFVFSLLLADFSPLRLIQVVQGAALMTLALNIVALWKQEPRRPTHADQGPRMTFAAAWSRFIGQRHAPRFLVAVGLGTAAFNMQDVVLEPYGAEVLKMSVANTTALTAMLATGGLTAFAVAARLLMRGLDPLRLAAFGVLAGVMAFACVILSGPFASPGFFAIGTMLIGFGGGLFAVGTLTTAMVIDRNGQTGLALGAWGAVQATAAGLGIAAGGVIRDGVSAIAATGLLGPAMVQPSAAYGVVYHIELGLLFATLVAIGPLVTYARSRALANHERIGLAEIPS
jgi:BCD family chlorophyll transporter-like MFS transporter